MPGSFAALFVVFVLLAIGSTVYRVSSARSRARSIGMDPDAATRAVLFNQQPDLALKNLELGHRLEQQEARNRASRAPSTFAPVSTPEAATTGSAEARLEELQRLYQRGLINEDEFADKRAAILNDL